MDGELGAFLRQHRQTVLGGISLRALARQSDGAVSFTYLSAVERNRNPKTGNAVRPSPDMLRALATLYGVSVSTLWSLSGYALEPADLEEKEAKSMIDREPSTGKPATDWESLALRLLTVMEQDKENERLRIREVDAVNAQANATAQKNMESLINELKSPHLSRRSDEESATPF